MPAREYRGARWISALGWSLAALSFLALIAISIAERSRRVETPRWDAARFALIRFQNPNAQTAAPLCCAPLTRDTSRAAPALLTGNASELWLVAVNPGCPHCRASLARVSERARQLGDRAHVAALLVDAPTRPDSAVIAGLAARYIYWDSAGVWKHRWGRHAYGESMIFDSTGVLLRIAPIAP